MVRATEKTFKNKEFRYGGNGGRGGNVIIKKDDKTYSLDHLNSRKIYSAHDGSHGGENYKIRKKR